MDKEKEINNYFEDDSHLKTLNSALSIGEICEEDFFYCNDAEKISDKLVNKHKLDIPFPSHFHFKKDDFEIICTMGRGAYAKVVKAKLIKDNSLYAVKIINKRFIQKVKENSLRKKNFIKSIWKMRF